MIHHIQYEQWVPFAIEKVFLFFANPQNLPRIMPPGTATQLAALRLVPPVLSSQQPEAGRDQLAGMGSYSILVAEDDSQMRELIRERLVRAGHRPICVKDGAEAIESIREAIQGHVQTLRELGESVPPPRSQSQVVAP